MIEQPVSVWRRLQRRRHGALAGDGALAAAVVPARRGGAAHGAGGGRPALPGGRLGAAPDAVVRLHRSPRPAATACRRTPASSSLQVFPFVSLGPSRWHSHSLEAEHVELLFTSPGVGLRVSPLLAGMQADVMLIHV